MKWALNCWIVIDAYNGDYILYTSEHIKEIAFVDKSVVAMFKIHLYNVLL